MKNEHGEFAFQIDSRGKTNLSQEEIVKFSVPTGASWKEVFECVLIPENVKGLLVLDVGAGASDAVAKLLELGANAYAIDPRYKNRSSLEGEVKLHNSLAIEDKESKKIRGEALRKFAKSMKRSPNRYLAASASRVPFPNNLFDIVYSRVAVTSYLDVDIDVFSASVYECLRVAKQGGTVRLHPYMDIEPTWPDELNRSRLRNEQVVVNGLMHDPKVQSIKVANVNINGQDWKTLIIEKAILA